MTRYSSSLRNLPVLLPVLLLGLVVPAVAQNGEPAAGASLPGLSELDEGWNDLHPGGETSCAHGGDYVFYARGADPTRLVVYLYGGGGCWDAETCDPEREDETYISRIIPSRHPAQQGGILDLVHPDNPVAGYSMVAVPVCTGDSHLGDRDATYSLESGSGETRQFIIRHRGQINAMSAMDWVRENFEAPRDVFVAGSSAGGVGTPFYGSLLAQRYPSARVVALGDDASSWRSAAVPDADPAAWGLPDVLRDHPGWEGFEASIGVEHLYTTAARSAPKLRLYQVDHAYDQAQRFYLELAGAEDPEPLPHIRATRRTIGGQVPEFRSFLVGGFQHTVLLRETLYQYETDGHRLRDWVAAIVAGEPVVSVDCGQECARPGLVYTEEDLRIMDRALELLSGPHAWNSRDSPGACPAQPERYTVRCAVVQAATEVTGRTPTGARNLPPAAWDMFYTVAGHLGPAARGDVVRAYNNHPGTTAADVIAVLEEVRARVRAGLQGEVGG